MGTKLLRHPEGTATPKDLDLLEELDLVSERHRRPGQGTRWIIAAVVAVIAIAAAVVVALVLTGGETAVAPEAAIEAPLTARELGRDPGPTARPRETDVIVLDHYGIAPALVHRSGRIEGRDPGPTARPRETDVIVLDHYGIAPALVHRSGRIEGRDPGPTARPRETDVIVLDYYGLSAAATVAPVPKVNPGVLLPQ